MATYSSFQVRCDDAIYQIDQILRGGSGMGTKTAAQDEVWSLMQEGFQKGYHRWPQAEVPDIAAWWKLARKAYNNPSSAGARGRAETIAHRLTAGHVVTDNERVFFREYLTHCHRPGADINAWKATYPKLVDQAMHFKASYEGGQLDQQPDTQEESKEEMFLKAQAARTIDGWVGQVHKYDNSGFQGESLIVWQGDPVAEDSGPTEEKKTTQQLAIDEAEAKINEVIAKLFQS